MFARILFCFVLRALVAGTMLAAATLTAQTPAQPPLASENLPTGTLIESVTCLDEPTQTYALYLPSRYTSDRPWPILYAFEPGARGTLPTKLFQAAAERLGYIVVCSNNSRNGPWQPILTALNAVWRDTRARLSIDLTRIYTTGCSGGNGPALILAEQQHAAGIIACAGAIDAEQVKAIDDRCAWISVAGIADYNYDLNRVLVPALLDRGMVARFTGFDGPHRWPPEDLATHALEFLHLNAMQTGLLARDDTFIGRYQTQGIARAQALVANHRADLAAEEYEALARELEGLTPTESFAAEARRLRAEPESEKNRRQEAMLAKNYDEAVGIVAALLDRLDSEGPNAPLRSTHRIGSARLLRDRRDLSDWQRDREDSEPEDVFASGDAGATVGSELDAHIEQLLRDRKSKKELTRIVATRVSDWLNTRSYFMATERRDEFQFTQALELFGVCSRLRPTNPTPVYEMARIHAAQRSTKKALAELKRARALGFKDLPRLETEPEWERLRTDKAFLRIVEAVRTAAAKEPKENRAPSVERALEPGTDAGLAAAPPPTNASVETTVVITKTNPQRTQIAPVRSRQNSRYGDTGEKADYVLPTQKVNAVFGDIDIMVLCGEAGHGYLDGVVITEVKPDTPAEKAGLRKGMEITEIMGQKLRGKVTQAHFKQIMDQSYEGHVFRLKVRDRLVVYSKTRAVSPYVYVTDSQPEQMENEFPSREILLPVLNIGQD